MSGVIIVSTSPYHRYLSETRLFDRGLVAGREGGRGEGVAGVAAGMLYEAFVRAVVEAGGASLLWLKVAGCSIVSVPMLPRYDALDKLRTACAITAAGWLCGGGGGGRVRRRAGREEKPRQGLCAR